ncbi:MAG: hypothetical protein OEX22_12710 [Cyclobacteriaceae bacterium]|nr:hypothetical protein [Cyclobacteriaceae bacterium]
MKKSKVVFLIIAGLFFIAMIYIAYDISSRTTRPGAKPIHLLEHSEENGSVDSIKVDSLQNVSR